MMSEDLDRLVSFWHVMRILTLGSCLYSWKVEANNKWIIKTIAIGSKFDEETEEIIRQWWTENRGNCKIRGPDLVYLLKRMNGDGDYFITTHWLAYIFDLQIPADRVWGAFGIFYTILKNCRNEGIEVFEEEGRFWEKDENDDTGKISVKLKLNNDIKFGHRFMCAKSHRLFERLYYTLRTLELFDFSLVYFLSALFERYPPQDDEWIRFIAFSLNYLTYRDIEELKNLPSTQDEYINMIIEKYEKVRLYENWIYETDNHIPAKRRIYVPGTKRMWSALKDYIFEPHLQRLIFESPNIGSRLKCFYKKILFPDNILKNERYIEQLELPGDSWNKRVVEKIKSIPEIRDIILSGDPRTSIRRVYLRLKEKSNELDKEKDVSKLYPVYLDYTFQMNEKSLDSFITYSKEFLEELPERCKSDLIQLYQRANCYFNVYL